ncbi:MAG: phosphohistidine phosphatase SixA [Nitrospirae bacterium]|nr:phosphohistidine phosphatase SixA [Nitrospirota bacterium]
MEVYLLRHASALPLSPALKRDEDRPLSTKGKIRMRRAATGLKKIGVRFDRMYTSPLVRARQTAQIVAEVYGWSLTRLEECKPLAPGGNASELLAILAGQNSTARVLLVGHEPDMSRTASVLLSGSPSQVAMVFKKGGLCRIDIAEMPPKGRGVLKFFLAPKQMRAFV